MEEIISTIVNNIINSFDFSFCITVNIATYLVIKTITNYKKKGKLICQIQKAYWQNLVIKAQI